MTITENMNLSDLAERMGDCAMTEDAAAMRDLLCRDSEMECADGEFRCWNGCDAADIPDDDWLTLCELATLHARESSHCC